MSDRVRVPEPVLVDRVLGEVLQLLEQGRDALQWLAHGDGLDTDAALADEVRDDGAGRRPAGTPDRAPVGTSGADGRMAAWPP